MNRICFYFNKPAKYREPIYRLMEKEFDADWHFGVSKNGLKLFDPSNFRSVTILDSIEWHGIKCTKGLISLLSKDYHQYLMLGETRDLSSYIFFLLKKIFFKEKKIFLWTHGWYGKESNIERIVKKLYYSCVDGIFLYGNYARECMIKEGFEPKKLFVVHNSLDYDTQLMLRNSMVESEIYSTHFSNKNPVICFIGRLKAVKKLDMVISSLHLLKQEGKNYNLVFIGDGECRLSLEKQVVEMGLLDQVWFFGECFDEKTNANLIYNADLCVAPGNVGLTAMHTLMFGCPVITHNDYKWQMPEFEAIIEGVTGSFFERDSVVSLKGAIDNWFIKKKGKREDVRKACYNEIDNSWNPYYQIEVIKRGINL